MSDPMMAFCCAVCGGGVDVDQATEAEWLRAAAGICLCDQCWAERQAGRGDIRDTRNKENRSVENQTAIEGWCIMDLFGHAKLAGYVSTAMVGTSGMIRVDVPEEGDMPGYTRFVGPGAIYSLTLVTEAVARQALRAIRPPAVTVYLPRQLPAGAPVAEIEDDGDEPEF